MRKQLAKLLAGVLLLTSIPLQVMGGETKFTSEPTVTQTITLSETQTTTSGVIILEPQKYVGDGYEVWFRVTSKWEDAFNGEIKIVNTSDIPLENWALKFDFEHQINTIWNAKITTHGGSSYILKNVDSNQDIAPGCSVTIGFEANGSKDIKLPIKYDLLSTKQETSNKDYTIGFKVTADWGQAFNGEFSITNTSTKPIEDWSLEFDFDRNIPVFWDAQIESHQNKHYVIKNKGYNANIAPGQTINLGFSGNLGNVVDEPINYKLNQIGEEIDYQKDTDKDGVPDWFEKQIGTHPNNVDTDEDELPDGYEYFILKTNPIIQDTDRNSILDGDEDFDKDGLTNIEEYRLETDPLSKDTDSDGLTDKEEIQKCGTNPLLEDTDEDGITDGDEIILGLNPLSKYTHEGIGDSEFQIKQSLEIEDLAINNDVGKFEVALDVTAAGCIKSNLGVYESAYIDSMSGNTAILGQPIDIVYDAGKVTAGTIRFKINSDYIYNNESAEYVRDTLGLKDIKRYNVFKYFEDDNMLLPIETKYDVNNGIVYADVEELGTYCVMDIEKWLNDLEIIQDETRYKLLQNTEILNNQKYFFEDESIQNMAKNTSSSMLDSASINTVEKSNVQYMNDNNIPYTYYNNFTYTNTEGELIGKNYFADPILPGGSVGGRSAFYGDPDYQSGPGHYAKFRVIDFKRTMIDCDFTEVVVMTHAGQGTEVTLSTSMDGQSWTVLGSVVDPLTSYQITHEFFVIKSADLNIKSPFRYLKSEVTQAPPSYSICALDFMNVYNNINIGDEFSAILMNGMNKIKLKGPLVKGASTDTDLDTLTDSQEVNWKFIDENGGKLPTVGECMQKKLGYVDRGINLNDIVTLRKVENTPILPILSDPTKKNGDGDDILDIDDSEPLRKNTIETMFILSKKNNKNNAAYIQIEDNDVTINLRLFFNNYVGDKKYVDLARNSILSQWQQKIKGSEYDFLKGIEGQVRVNIEEPTFEELYDKGDLGYIQINIEEIGIPMTPSAPLWNMQKNGFIVLPIRDVRSWNMNEHLPFIPQDCPLVSEDWFARGAGHEVGHILGLWDIYPEANMGKELISNPEIANGNGETKEGSIMWNCSKAIMSNDIEMVLQAFKENKMQFYSEFLSTSGTKSTVVRFPQQFQPINK